MEMHFNVPDPEAWQEQMQQQADRAHMAQADAAHSVQRMFTEMSKEHLLTLRFLLHIIGQNPSAAVYYEGVTSTTLVLVHGACSCGEDHDAVADALLDRVEGTSTPPDMGTQTQVQHQVTDLEAHGEAVSTLPEAQNPIQPNMTFDELLRAMEEFNVEPVPDDATGRVQCMNCGTVSVSLDDRMLRKECGGCIEKEKWG